MGAAGRDFHNFNVVFRDNRSTRGRRLHRHADPRHRGRALSAGAGRPLYPDGIPIHAGGGTGGPHRGTRRRRRWSSPTATCSHEHVMHRAVAGHRRGRRLRACSAPRTRCSRPQAGGCGLRGAHGRRQEPDHAARRGAAARRRASRRGRRAPPHALRRPGGAARAALRHARRPGAPSLHDRGDRGVRAAHRRRARSCTPAWTTPRSSRQAENEADVILWDGGNNDPPFYRPDLHIVVADPLRAGHELRYHPGEANLRMARRRDHQQGRHGRRPSVDAVRDNIRRSTRGGDRRGGLTGDADGAESSRGKRVLVVEDGPTVTHGEMTFGAGAVLAREVRRRRTRGPAAVRRRHASATTLTSSTRHSARILPAMGYGERAGARAREDHRRGALRRGGHRHAHRPQPRRSRSTSQRCACATTCRKSAGPILSTSSGRSWPGSTNDAWRRAHRPSPLEPYETRLGMARDRSRESG